MTTPLEAVAQGEAEYAALLTMLRTLAPADWSQPTECPEWTVRDMVAHINGAAEEAVRRRVQLRHLLVARTRDRTHSSTDSLSAQQIADRKGRTPAELVAELAELAATAPRGRAATPRFVRALPLPKDAGALPGDKIGYLVDVIYQRDVWMHRIDIARATGCELVASDAEREIVAGVARDLSRGWTGVPFTLTLTGRMVGSWRIGLGDRDGGEVSVDTVAMCRLLAGRSDETRPVFQGSEPGTVEDLLRSRVLF